MSGIYQKYSDNELVNLLRLGDELAFTLLYGRYSRKMYINILKMVKDEKETEEIIQVLFSKIWHKRLAISLEKDFSAYLYRCAQNLVIDYYRKLQRERQLSDQFKLSITEHYTHIEEGLQYRESERILQQALANLSPQQRNVYQLCKLEGCSYRETALKLGISTHTVKEYLSKAKVLVKNYMISNQESWYI